MANFRRSVDERALKGKHNSTFFGGSGFDANRRLTNLYIRNVPTSWSEDDLQSIFHEFGNVKSILIGTSKPMQKFTWALLEYDHYKNAEVAITELDGCPPYNLLVSYSRTDEEKQSIHLSKQQEYEHSYEEPVFNQIKQQPRRHAFGRPAAYSDEDDNSDEQIYDQPLVTRHHGNNWDSKVNMSKMKLVFNKNGERQITMGPPAVSSSTLGPMIPVDNISQEKRQLIDAAITNMMFQLQQKKSGAGDIGDAIGERCGSCAVCGTITVNACNRCQLWYCGRKCQVKDWPRHMHHCAPLPDLQCMKIDDNAAVTKDDRKFKPTPNVTNKFEDVGKKDEGQFGNKNRTYDKFQENKSFNDRNSNSEDRNKGFVDRNTKFGDSDKSFGARSNRSGDNRSNSFENRNSHFDDKNKGFGDRNRNFEDRNKGTGQDRNRGFGNKPFGDNRNNDQFKNDRRDFGRTDRVNSGASNTAQDAKDSFWDDDIKKTSTPNKDDTAVKGTVFSKPFAVVETPNSVSPRPYAVIETPRPVQPRAEAPIPAAASLLPIGITKEVTITNVIDPGHYFVQVNDKLSSYKEMLFKLNEAAVNAESVTPVEKMKCIAKQANEILWLRGMVKSVSPLLVFFVDYGTAEIVRADQIKAIPEEFTRFPRMAVRVKLAPGTRKDFYNKIEDDKLQVKATTRDAEGIMIVEVVRAETMPTPSRDESTSSARSRATPNVYDHILPADVFSMVVVSSVDSETDLWVQSISQINTLVGLFEEVMNAGTNAGLFTPILGAKCLGFYQDCWNRAEVESVAPLKVRYIDFGNLEDCTVDNLRAMPSNVDVLPPQACKIHLADGTPKEFWGKKVDETLEVKPVSQDNNGVVTVHVKGHNYSEPAAPEPVASGSKTNAKFSEENNVIELLKKDASGLIEVCRCVNSKQFIVSIKCNEMSELNTKLTTLSNILEELPHDQSFKPELNDVVGVQYKDPEDETLQWGRAVQYLKDKYTLCDEGLEVTPLQLKRIPASYDNLPYLAAFCILETPKVSTNLITDTYFKVGSSMFFDVTKINDGSVEASLQDDRKTINVAQVVLKPWQRYSFVPSNELKSGSSVTLASFYSFDELYVLVENPESLGFLNQLKQQVQNEPQLSGSPNIGDVVACLFTRDKQWYRAKILAKNGDEYEVFYVDYGTKATSTVANMKPLPRTYTNIPFHAIKVALANKLDKPFTKPALAFLTGISEDGESLKIGNDDLTSVVLLRNNGDSLNDELNNIIDPNWANNQQEPQDAGSNRLMFNQLPKIKLTEGSVLELFVLAKSDPKVFVACDRSSPVCQSVSDLFVKLGTYCNNLPSSPYKPVVSELCAAVFEEDSQWYRALCMEVLEDECKVMFIDFGNEGTVKYSNIRELNEEFIKTPAMGYICVYDNEGIKAIPEGDPRSSILDKRIAELITENTPYEISVKKEDGISYYVDIPSVTRTLQEEKLL